MSTLKNFVANLSTWDPTQTTTCRNSTWLFAKWKTFGQNLERGRHRRIRQMKKKYQNTLPPTLSSFLAQIVLTKAAAAITWTGTLRASTFASFTKRERTQSLNWSLKLLVEKFVARCANTDQRNSRLPSPTWTKVTHWKACLAATTATKNLWTRYFFFLLHWRFSKTP